jgi:hypothetical protein
VLLRTLIDANIDVAISFGDREQRKFKVTAGPAAPNWILPGAGTRAQSGPGKRTESWSD